MTTNIKNDDDNWYEWGWAWIFSFIFLITFIYYFWYMIFIVGGVLVVGFIIYLTIDVSIRKFKKKFKKPLRKKIEKHFYITDLFENLMKERPLLCEYCGQLTYGKSPCEYCYHTTEQNENSESEKL